jgi:RecT family
MNDIIPVYGLVPQSMGEAMKLADHMADAKLVPAALQKSAADCLLVIEQATRWQMSPFAVAQECSVIQGKIMYSGKLVAAVVNSRGNLQNRLSYTYEGEGDSRTVIVSGRLQGEIEPRTVNVTIRNARTANKVWTTQPDQQLAYHGARVWARRHTPELMLGVYSPEEFEPEPLRASSKLPPKPAPNVLLQNPEVAETIEDLPQQATPAAANSAPVSPDDSPTPDIDQDEAGANLISFAQLEAMAREAAEQGRPTFNKFYKERSGAEKAHLNTMGDELAELMEPRESK